jgi:hypothetical protein
MALNIWKDIYIRSIRKKVPFKNTLYFEKYKKDKFLTNRYTILILFTIRNLPKHNVFFNVTFFAYTSSVCIYLCI